MNPDLEMMRTKVPDLWRVNGWQLSSGGIFAAYSAEAYLFSGDYPVLIDCGSHLTFDELCANLAILGVGIYDIKMVIGTHSHWDHIGNMAKIREQAPAVQFAIHAYDADEARRGFHDDLSPNIYGIGVEPDMELTDEQILTVGSRSFQCFLVPGHSPGSICIYTSSSNGKRLLFTGDALHGIYAPTSEKDIIADFKNWADGLEKISNLEIDLLFEGHVMPQMEDITLLTPQQKATYVDDLLEKMDSWRRGNPDVKETILKRLFLLRGGFVSMTDYYISKACQMAGTEDQATSLSGL